MVVYYALYFHMHKRWQSSIRVVNCTRLRISYFRLAVGSNLFEWRKFNIRYKKITLQFAHGNIVSFPKTEERTEQSIASLFGIRSPFVQKIRESHMNTHTLIRPDDADYLAWNKISIMLRIILFYVLRLYYSRRVFKWSSVRMCLCIRWRCFCLGEIQTDHTISPLLGLFGKKN